MLLSFRPPKPMAFMQLPRLVNQETNMQAALPAIEVHRLFDNLGIGFDALRIIALLIIVIFVEVIIVFSLRGMIEVSTFSNVFYL